MFSWSHHGAAIAAFLGCRFHADKPCYSYAQHGGAGREANLIFVLPPNVYVGPPGRGAFWFQIFIQAPSPEVWRKSISGGEGGCWRGNGVACFWATSFGKNYRRRDRDRLVPPRWMDTAVYRAEVCYPSVGSTGVTSSEAARVHID